tara:strand:- start:50 stop:580 length:531 start_codon:yes stop_codon:yes gene_type:complete
MTSINKLKLSILTSFKNLATDTEGMLLCCTDDDNGQPIVHRVVITECLVGLLSRLRTPSGRSVMNLRYPQGRSDQRGFRENDVYIKPIAYDFSTIPKGITLEQVRWAMVGENISSVEAVEEAIISIQNERTVIVTEQFEEFLENMTEEQVQTLKDFILSDKEFSNSLVDELVKRVL